MLFDPADPFAATRRSFLRELGGSVGLLGMASYLRAADPKPTPPSKTHFKPRAKRVIFLFMAGAPSHLDTFDPKPELEKHAGKRPTAADLRTERVTAGLMPPSASESLRQTVSAALVEICCPMIARASMRKGSVRRRRPLLRLVAMMRAITGSAALSASIAWPQ